MYVIHACFGPMLHRHFDSYPVVFVLQMAVTIPLAALSWYFFESPVLKQKRRWPMPSRRIRHQFTGTPGSIASGVSGFNP